MSAREDKAGEPRNRSGGGIAFGGGTRSAPPVASTLAGSMIGLRRRWTSGIAVVTVLFWTLRTSIVPDHSSAPVFLRNASMA